ncbi:hypothetical protein MMC15_002710 [Xylographa vitiligo]|nr:hypothetical protein [Xylographa vitiligo]
MRIENLDLKRDNYLPAEMHTDTAGSKKRKRVSSEISTHPLTTANNNDTSFKQRLIKVTRSSLHDSSKPGASEPSPFFRLPREIRDEILALCLLPPNTMITGGAYPHPPYLGWYDDLCAPLDLYCPGKPTFALLTVSKQMHEEAAFNLYTRSRFHFLIATTHCANLINPSCIENNILQIAPGYLRMMKRIVLVVAIEAFCCHLPRYEYVRVKSAVQKFAEYLSRPDKKLVRLDIRYSEFESDHTRASHFDSRRRPDHEWTRSQVMDHLRVEFNGNHHLGSSAVARPATRKHRYQYALEPLGTLYGVKDVCIYGVDAEFGAQLKKGMQSKEKLCGLKPTLSHDEKDRTGERNGEKKIKWWDSTHEWNVDRPQTNMPGADES